MAISIYMKKLLFILLVLNSNLYAQNKHGNSWIFGDGSTYITIAEWLKDTVIKKQIPTKSGGYLHYPNACISNTAGKLLFYTNGCCIMSGFDYKILPNGTQINPNQVHDEYCGANSSFIYPADDNVMFLPHPTDTSKYYLFHTARKPIADSIQSYPFAYFYYTSLSTAKEPKGEIVKKNVLLTENQLSEASVNSCKHGNGADWWIVVPKTFGHGYVRALLTKDTVQYMGEQNLAEPFGTSANQWNGQAVFSPDGSKYVRADPRNGMYIYDFDRCTGLLSKPIHIDSSAYPNHGAVTLVISPNSRYLYLSNIVSVYQYDLWAKDIPASQTYIAGYTIEPDATYIFRTLLAPDGKIYFGTDKGTFNLHAILQPDSAGTACQFVFDYFPNPIITTGYLPNMPNYNLGPKIGSPCEKALGSTEIIEQDKILVYPNPVNGQLYISSSIYFSTLWVSDITGRQVKKIVTSPYRSDYQIDTYDLEDGIYFIKGISENGVNMAAQRFVVQH
jgi:hypothetical protein